MGAWVSRQTTPPRHVCAAFGVQPGDLEELPGVGAPVWQAGGVLLRQVADTAEAAWVAQTMDALVVHAVRLARPLRSSDGRWVVGGWTASRRVTGRLEPRHDEVVAVSLRLHEATAGLPRPRFLASRTGLYAMADRAAWEEQAPTLDQTTGGIEFDEFAGKRQPTGLRSQVVHGDLFGNVLFADNAAPALIDFTPYWRPPEWAAAVIVVDALAWGGADAGLVHRWAQLADWPQALLRALLFRLAAHAMHPRSTAESLAGLHHAGDVIRSLL